MDEEDESSYEKMLEKMKQEEARADGPRNKRIKRLMRGTFKGRRDWIMKDTPKVSEILQVFPSLKQTARVKQLLICKFKSCFIP